MDSPVNISEIPARGAAFPSPTDFAADYSLGKQLLILAKEGVEDQTDGFFDPELLIGSLYPHVYARTGGGRP